MPKELIERQTLSQLIDAYNDAVKRVTGAVQEIAAAKKILRARLGSLHDNVFDAGRLSDHDFDSPERLNKSTEERIRAKFWSYSIKLTGIEDLMGPKELERMHDMMQDRSTLPVFDTDNILATLNGLVDSRPQIFIDSVLECYEWLRPLQYIPRHKTNYEATWKVPDKVIKEIAVENWGYGFRLMLDTARNLRHMDRVFHMLDGTGHPERPADLVSKIEDTMINRRHAPQEVKTEYFKAKWFKAGTLHLWFKRADLLKEFNRIAAEGSNQLGHDRKAA